MSKIKENKQKRLGNEGFTLIELLVVIAIIAILAVIVFVALDPVTRFADSRNSRRWTDINNILTAIHEYTVDNGGTMPTGITSDSRVWQLGSDGAGCNAVCTSGEAACLDLSALLAKYLKSMPLDPDGGTAGKTYYSVSADANNLITIDACNAENGETVEVSR